MDILLAKICITSFHLSSSDLDVRSWDLDLLCACELEGNGSFECFFPSLLWMDIGFEVVFMSGNVTGFASYVCRCWGWLPGRELAQHN